MASGRPLQIVAVPAFADWCLVHLAEPVAGRRLHAAGADADGSRVAEAVERLANIQVRESVFYDDIEGEAPRVGQIL